MPVADGPFTAQVSSDGCLDILDGSCQLVWSSHQGFKSKRSPPGVASSAGSFKMQPGAMAGAGRPPKAPPAKASKVGSLPQGFNKASPSLANANKQTSPAASGTGTSKATPATALQPSLVGSKAAVGVTAAATCTLAAGQACGGISLCGSDRPCGGKGCCAAGLTCVRRTAFTHTCGTGAPA
jgi:hypothetical protein